MQASSSLLTVKQVATALGIDDRSVRDKLALGTLKGVKKTVGNKDQWFVHQRDLDAELARRGLAQPRTPLQPDGSSWGQQSTFQQAFQNNDFPSASGFVNVSAQPPEVTHATGNASPIDFSEGVAEVVTEAQVVPETDKSTSGGERFNWLNEDVQKQLQMTAEVFMKPLVERIEALTAADKEKDAVIRAKDEELEEAREQLRLLPDFEAQRAKLLNEIKSERQAAELQFAKAKDREEEARALTEENENLRQKAEEAILSAAKLEALEKVVLELQKPKPSWFKKLFLPSH